MIFYDVENCTLHIYRDAAYGFGHWSNENGLERRIIECKLQTKKNTHTRTHTKWILCKIFSGFVSFLTSFSSSSSSFFRFHHFINPVCHALQSKVAKIAHVECMTRINWSRQVNIMHMYDFYMYLSIDRNDIQCVVRSPIYSYRFCFLTYSCP